MRLRIVAFATAADLLGGREISFEAPDGVSVGELLDLIESSTPGFDVVRSRLAVAVDGRLADAADSLSPGAEVALLPPVSGGIERARGSAGARLTKGPIDIARLTAETSTTTCGAQLVFLGRVRSGEDGAEVTHLTYDAYETMAVEALTRICRELSNQATGTTVAIVHRLGEVPAGEPSVAIVAVSPHRAEAYAASRTALERLKKEAPIWKREHFADGSSAWREEESLALSPSIERP